MHRLNHSNPSLAAVLVAIAAIGGLIPTASLDADQVDERTDIGNPADVLTSDQWEQVDRSVDRALAWIATQQAADGSFPTYRTGQPGVTALCVLAFLSRGHLPGHGPYGQQIDRAIDFVLSTQRSTGLFSHVEPEPGAIAYAKASQTALYNHGIAGLMLGEVYGMTSGDQHERIRQAITKGIVFSREYQIGYKRNTVDKGGWRYLTRDSYNNFDSDMSVTGWQLMFLRSARNAGFEIDTQYVDDALGYVRRCFDRRSDGFLYGLSGSGRTISRGTTGAGILSLSLAGEHQSDLAQRAGRWLLSQSFDNYNAHSSRLDRYHYSAYYCSQAMFQLGGEYWARFYPPLARTLMRNQNADGSWQLEQGNDSKFGNVYTTSLVVLSLTPPHQLLPIYQR